MKILALLLAVLVAAGGAVLYQRTRQAQKQQQLAIATSTAEAERVAAETRELRDAKVHAEEEREKLLKLTREMGTELDRRNQEATNKLAAEKTAGAKAESNPAGGFGSALAKMMKDPETKKFIREQQRMMMDTMYAPLIRQMGLKEEEADQFKNFLADQMMKSADHAAAFMGGENVDRAEQLKAMAEQQKTIEKETQEFLGEERYAQYKEYQLTLNERVQLNMFRQQQSGDAAINEAQAEQLLGVIKQEKAALAAEPGMALPSAQGGNNMNAMLSDEAADQMVRSQETLNQRVYQRATEVLQPEQLASFARFQTNQLQTMRMGINMARKMFAPQK